MSITYFASGKVLDELFGSVTLTAPATWYIGLSTSSPGNSGSGVVEPSSGSYARIAVTNNKTEFASTVNGVLRNLNPITFPESGSSWGTITDVTFWDNSTGGSVWFYQALSSPKVVQENTTVFFSASAIVVSMTN